METINHPRDAELQDIDGRSVREQLQDINGRSHATYVAEYGVNADSGAYVFHFFPPGHPTNEDATWLDFAEFHNRLESAIMRNFSKELATNELVAGYVEELKSFYVILKQCPSVPDLSALLNLFFRDLEA